MTTPENRPMDLTGQVTVRNQPDGYFLNLLFAQDGPLEPDLGDAPEVGVTIERPDPRKLGYSGATQDTLMAWGHFWTSLDPPVQERFTWTDTPTTMPDGTLEDYRAVALHAAQALRAVVGAAINRPE